MAPLDAVRAAHRLTPQGTARASVGRRRLERPFSSGAAEHRSRHDHVAQVAPAPPRGHDPAARDRTDWMAAPSAKALAEEGEAGTCLDVPVAGRDGARGAERAHVFTRLLEKAELAHRRIHDLRHSYATLLLQAGAPITYISQQLGHRDASITLRVYAHWLPDASRREADRLDTLQPSATPAQPEAVSNDQVMGDKSFVLNGEPRRNRTFNPQIKSLLLCQLS